MGIIYNKKSDKPDKSDKSDTTITFAKLQKKMRTEKPFSVLIKYYLQDIILQTYHLRSLYYHTQMYKYKFDDYLVSK